MGGFLDFNVYYFEVVIIEKIYIGLVITVIIMSQKAQIGLDPKINEVISTIKNREDLHISTLYDQLCHRFSDLDRDDINLGQLILAGSEETGFIGCMGALDAGSGNGPQVEGIPMPYQYLPRYLTHNNDRNLLLIVDSEKTRENIVRTLQDEYTNHIPYEINYLEIRSG